MKLKFKPEDFSRAELQRKLGDHAGWFYERLAQIANERLQEMLAEGQVVYGHKIVRDELSIWTNVYEYGDDCRALVVDVEELKR